MPVHVSRRAASKILASLAPAAALLHVSDAAAQAAPGADRVKVTAADGHQFTAYRAAPSGPSKGGVVILHAVYGLVPSMGAICAAWAKAGYTAIAPALFDRIKTDTTYPYTRDGVVAGSASYNALTEAQIFADISACVGEAGGAERTAISGFCTGGSWAWRAASKMRFPAHINFYGSHVATPELIDMEPQCPTVIHYGDKDVVVPLADSSKILARHPSLKMFIYPGAGHAFLNPDQDTYHAASAPTAWARSIAFMDEHVGSRKG